MIKDDHIIKAVKHCVDGLGCNECPYEYMDHCVEVEELLIFIKKLTEKHEYLKEMHSALGKLFELTCESNKKLTDENETMRSKIVADLQIRFAAYFGTYSKNDTVKIADVFKLLEQFKEDIQK